MSGWNLKQNMLKKSTVFRLDSKRGNLQSKHICDDTSFTRTKKGGTKGEFCKQFSTHTDQINWVRIWGKTTPNIKKNEYKTPETHRNKRHTRNSTYSENKMNNKIQSIHNHPLFSLFIRYLSRPCLIPATPRGRMGARIWGDWAQQRAGSQHSGKKGREIK